ncbi:MAG: DUF3520 domain-containing protein [Thiotrichaceae bacterium]|nr:DUF3520 domain-containing protein [Thiotrichaceae bacterium]
MAVQVSSSLILYKQPGEHRSIEMKDAIVTSVHKPLLASTSNNFRFVAAVAGFGQRLRSSDSLGDYSYPEILKLAQQSRGNDPLGYRAEFIQLVKLADSLQ